MTMDLERRLEDQALQCMQAESESISNDKKWAARFEEVTKVSSVHDSEDTGCH